MKKGTQIIFKICKRCGELKPHTSSDDRCQDCRKEYNHGNRAKQSRKKWNLNNVKTERSFLYSLDMHNLLSIYIGSTNSLIRSYRHFQGHSHLKEFIKSEADWITWGIHKISYIEVTDIVNNKAELEYLERLMILKHDPILNDEPPTIAPYLTAERMRELDEIVEKYLSKENWKERVVKVEDGKIVNYKDLKLI